MGRRGRSVGRFGRLAVAMMLATLAACGRDSGAVAPAVTTTTAVSLAPTTQPVAPGSTARTTVSTTPSTVGRQRPTTVATPAVSAPPASPTPCTTAQLKVSPTATRTSGTIRTETFTVVNTSPNDCSMSGYPTVLPYGVDSSVQAGSSPIPTSEGAIGRPAELLQLAPRGSVLFFMQWSEVDFLGICQNADGIGFDTPIPTTLVQVPFPFRFCGRIVRLSTMLPTGTA